MSWFHFTVSWKRQATSPNTKPTCLNMEIDEINKKRIFNQNIDLVHPHGNAE